MVLFTTKNIGAGHFFFTLISVLIVAAISFGLWQYYIYFLEDRIEFSQEREISKIFIEYYPDTAVDYTTKKKENITLTVIRGKYRLYLTVPADKEQDYYNLKCDKLNDDLETYNLIFESEENQDIMQKIDNKECFK